MDSSEKPLGIEIDEALLEEFKNRYRPFAERPPVDQYVAFLDILGFRNMVRSHYETTLEIYEKLIDMMRMHQIVKFGVDLQIYSDSIILISSELPKVISAANMVQFTTLMEGFLIRGGIGHGRHIDVKDGQNTYMISEALINAVEREKSVRMPCVALHESISIPDDWWPIGTPTITRSLVHYDGLNIASPLNPFWGNTAIDRVEAMKEQHPEHADKYDWFLEMCMQILEGRELVPEHVLP